MTKLTDTQLVVLSAAAARDDRSVLPLPKSLNGGAVTKVLNALLTRGLIEQIEYPRFAVEDSFRITRTGLQAINADDDLPPQGGDVAVEPDNGAQPPRKGNMPTRGPTAADRDTPIMRASPERVTILPFCDRAFLPFRAFMIIKPLKNHQIDTIMVAQRK